MTIREFVRAVWDGKYLAMAALVLVFAGAFVYVENQAIVYGSSAVVRINAGAAMTADQPPATIDATFEDALTAPVIEAAAATLGMTPEALRPAVEATSGSDDGAIVVVTVRLTDQSAVRPAADAVAEAFVAHVAELRDAQVAALEVQRNAYREANTDVENRIAQNPGDVLAGADQGTIISLFTETGLRILGLKAIQAPAEVVEEASPAEVQGFPRRTVLPVAALAGLLAGVALALAKRGLDFRVRNTAQAAKLTGLPVLAALNGVRNADRTYRRDGVLPVSSRAATPFTESIRELRTAVQVSVGSAPHVVVVTAADPRPPRSFIVANLAASLALSGLRTVAVSGDLRRSYLDGFLPAPEGWHGDEHAPRPTRVPNLEVLRIFDDGMDPADYLATARVRDLIDTMRHRVDVVVVDAPPVLAAADATILGGYSDAVVLVAAAGRTERSVLSDAAERLRVTGVPAIGVALAGVEGDQRKLYATTYETDDGATGWRRLFGRGGSSAPVGHQAATAARAQVLARVSEPAAPLPAMQNHVPEQRQPEQRQPAQPQPAGKAAVVASAPAQAPAPAAQAPAPAAQAPAAAAAPAPAPAKAVEPTPEPRPMPVAIPPIAIPPREPRRPDGRPASEPLTVAGRQLGSASAPPWELLSVRANFVEEHDGEQDTDRVPHPERVEGA